MVVSMSSKEVLMAYDAVKMPDWQISEAAEENMPRMGWQRLTSMP
jgi:hypothetical protein